MMERQYNALALSELHGGGNSLSMVRIEGGKVVASNGIWSHLSWSPAYHDEVWTPSRANSTLYTGEIEYKKCNDRKKLVKMYIEAMRSL